MVCLGVVSLLQLCWQLVIIILVVASCGATGSSSPSSKVESLPGFHGHLPIQLQTGYIGVGNNEEVQLFYYFIKSENNPKFDPLLLWLNGGPGCSALSGLFYEIGPLTFSPTEYNGSLPTLISNPYSWTKVASIIMVDLPVGTGFSYATNEEARHSNSTLASQHAYHFILKWINDHQEFGVNSFYLSGDSYSGVLIPIIAQMISHGTRTGIHPYINLKGYILGNPLTLTEEDNYKFQFAHGMGLISDELFECLKNCKGVSYERISAQNEDCYEAFQYFTQVTSNINPSHILEPSCEEENVKTKKRRALRKVLNEKSKYLISMDPLHSTKCRTNGYELSYHWANNESVREALHVRKGTVHEWERCNHHLDFTTTTKNVVSYHLNLSTDGFRSLIYSGDHDFIIPFLSTQSWIHSLNYSIIDDWRPWIVQRQVAGYTRTYKNKMTFATVKGAGHTAPEYKPKEALAMLRRWLSYQPL